MKIKTRGIVVSVSSLIILTSIATASCAQTPTKSLKDQLVGHWQLVSVTIDARMPYGANPQGSMLLDASGHFSVIVISAGNARSISYFGTYTVNDADKSMTTHIEASSGGSGISVAARDEKRLITFSGDDLIVQSQTPTGAPGTIVLTWKQAN
jgi:hypothetical protein